MTVRVCAVSLLPEPLPDDHDGLGSRTVVAGHEIAAEARLLTQETEGVDGEPGSTHLLRQTAIVADVHRRRAISREARERAALAACFLKVRELESDVVALTRLPAEHVKAIRIRDRQSSKKRGVDDAKARRVGADPERQRDDGGGREPRILGHQPEGEPDVLQGRFDGRQAADRAMLLLDREPAHPTESAPHGAPALATCRGGRCPPPSWSGGSPAPAGSRGPSLAS